jgi:glycerophosphoryl diester phosphodiesterase
VTRYVAHRGGAAQWPENSLTAFRSAIAGGAQILECDVHLTADGEVAVIHDPTLERTSSGTGPIARCTLADLRRARLRGPDGALTADCVPTLREVLALAAPVVAAMLVEMKTPGPAVRYERRGDRFVSVPGARYEGLERKVLELLREAGLAERAFLLAFNPAVLAEVRALAPKQPLALLVDHHHVEEAGAPAVETVAWAREAGANFLGLHYGLCDAAVVEAAHGAGMAVGVFTVNDEATMRRLAGWGVDVILSDRPDVVARLQGET